MSLNASKQSKILVLLLPMVILSILFWVKFSDHRTYRYLVNEDGLIEYATFLAYSLACLIAVYGYFSIRKQNLRMVGKYLLFLSAACLFVAGEEISWGQRIFGFNNPEFFSQNSVQKETNIHNLRNIAEHVNLVFIGLGLVMTLGCIFHLLLSNTTQNTKLVALHPFLPHWSLFFYFLPTLAFFIYIEFLFPSIYWWDIKFKEQEPVEFILSLGMLFYVSYLVFKTPTSPEPNYSTPKRQGE